MSAKQEWLGPREKKMFERLQKICLALPGAVESIAWRQPVFRVNDSIFASFAPGHGGLHIAFRAKSRAVLDDPQVKVAPMGERQGWVLRMIGDDETAATMDWKRIGAWIRESHELVAATKTRKRKPAAKPRR